MLLLFNGAAEDVERTREVYRACLKLIPHRAFTFSKIWIMAAQFEIRQLRLDAARKILGMGIGMCPKVGGCVGPQGQRGRGAAWRVLVLPQLCALSCALLP